MDLIRDLRICKDCKHFLKDGFCAVLDKPEDFILEDIQWEIDRDILTLMAAFAGEKDLKFERSVKRDRKLDSSCPYILEQVVLRQ